MGFGPWITAALARPRRMLLVLGQSDRHLLETFFRYFWQRNPDGRPASWSSIARFSRFLCAVKGGAGLSAELHQILRLHFLQRSLLVRKSHSNVTKCTAIRSGNFRDYGLRSQSS